MIPTKAQQQMIEDGLPADLVMKTPEERRKAWAGIKPRATKTFADLKPAKTEDPATKALRKEIAAAAEKKKAEQLARLKELKTKKVVDARTQTLRAMVAAVDGPKKKGHDYGPTNGSGPTARPTNPHPDSTSGRRTAAEAATQESDVKKPVTKKMRAAKKAKAKPAKKPAAKTAARANARKPVGTPSGANSEARRGAVASGSLDTVIAMLKSPTGATMDELVAATKIEAHPMRAKIKRAREVLGVGVDHEAYEGPSKENGHRYRVDAEKLPKAES